MADVTPELVAAAYAALATGQREQIAAGENPGTIRQGMDRFDLAGLDRPSQRLWRDLEELRGLAEVEPWLDPVLGRLEYRDTGVGAHRRDVLAGPSIAVARDKAVAVEDAGDQIVIGDEHELACGGDDVS